MIVFFRSAKASGQLTHTTRCLVQPVVGPELEFT